MFLNVKLWLIFQRDIRVNKVWVIWAWPWTMKRGRTKCSSIAPQQPRAISRFGCALSVSSTGTIHSANMSKESQRPKKYFFGQKLYRNKKKAACCNFQDYEVREILHKRHREELFLFSTRQWPHNSPRQTLRGDSEESEETTRQMSRISAKQHRNLNPFKFTIQSLNGVRKQILSILLSVFLRKKIF